MKFDWVSLKIDSAIESIWHKTDRPHRSLQLNAILDGMLEFRKIYQGELVTETMLVKDTNDS
jgi:wyosine [tRNA(Phe)-imidazoG37] synthetase (radical SAM superfamily)